jgi:hypothetical protein
MNIMHIIIDKKIPQEAKNKLSSLGILVELETAGITYDGISGHPDVFFHQMEDILIYAPNLPEKYIRMLQDENIKSQIGEQDVGAKYPVSSCYNAVSTQGLLIHNFRNTDSTITRKAEDADLIHVDQGYTRCNLLALDDDHFITCDKGIERVLHRFDKDCLYVDPEGILLEGFDHGFFGGCCGILGKEVFMIGSLEKFPAGEAVRKYLEGLDFSITELYGGPLFDGGSIIFVN